MVYFNLRQRRVLREIFIGRTNADIAVSLELSVTTVNLRRRQIKARAGLVNDEEIVPYTVQNPGVLVKGGHGTIGLHTPSPTCNCYSCWILRGLPVAA
jgi:DNA-binding CsgD family transcriptional regulator